MIAEKVLFLVLDGISDRPCEALNGLTPLSAAETPVLNQLAAEGVCGIMDTIAPGIRPGSDTSHLALLGYPPQDYYTGRGPLEAEGTGIHMTAGMIGFRCNFATVDRDGLIIDRRAGRISGTGPLSAAIREGVDLSALGVGFRFESGAGHRAALALIGEGLGDRVSSNDPKKEGVRPLPIRACSDDPADEKTARACNEFISQSAEILAAHPLNAQRVEEGLPPANFLLIRGAGKMGTFPNFQERYGLSGSVISAATLISGIGKVVGLEHIPVPGTTGSVDSDLDAKVEATLGELKRKDFVLLNIKGADEAGHDGNVVQKRDFIEVIDAALEPLLALPEDTLLVICADHSTPCSVRDHSADPVPVVIRGPGVRVDRTVRFDEVSCAEGGLNRIRGCDIMPIILDLINKSHKYGA
ncbi:MAG TPA: 2,3-bisphosphoglycerate-independent phosphoglycerate mutase [Candidatus Methanoculleus thermohydrogenotrophicum]|jgi:2,3-bisphosphoglycerate-independent phosphoglycerate mutase|nr:2,3-bisphosphoglycerate-independent phosphoglycerate mutase [Candidatus Methanoculleus thermohydrogenotrophicum]NLM81388.1 2,3-bisphosphoglycerate-independent phosphoglycerate mutase [Candidatus Methanoculleus thermohydrogenotrophicum]HOB17792.1 2,3-bisphosphoglycerate-independent phosphoglycerate mutase [Candidatus Methanoculleus thermohydrogenotrophicum]HPZ37959.1 2,3-bisphosphoglycerate-independent phosphoglycerate mutase [Candidatus Methanoculleus thermohydrogenotrophicum]